MTGTSPVKALALAKRVISEELPGAWDVRPMGRESRDFTVRRPRKTSNPTVSQAFDLAYRLRQNRDVEDCEVALVQSLVGPPELQLRRAAVRASGPSNQDLSCSADHLWIHDLCSIQSAWNLPRPSGGQPQGVGIVVGHPDTGYSDHPQVNDPARLLTGRGFDFEDEDPDARDPLTGSFGGHGTATGNVIMSAAEDPAIVTGVAPRCSLVPLRVTNSVILVSFGNLAEAIRFAADEGHHVLSISLGGPLFSRYLSRAIDYALERGLIIVCAAGNVWPFVVYPARLDGVIAAAACNCRKATWADSASGSAVDITAPGESVWRASAEPGGFGVARSSGTSYATAIVAGTAALWLAHHSRQRLVNLYGAAGIPRVFKELLLSRGFDRPSGWDTSNFGVGILNASKLLSAPLPSTAPANALRALRVTPGARSTNQVDEILELFPGENSAKIRRGLAHFLNVNERDLNATLRDVSDEIAYLAVTDMTFRRQIAQTRAPRRAHPKGTSASMRRRATGQLSRPSMSRHLRGMTSLPTR